MDTMVLQSHKKLDSSVYKIICRCSNPQLDYSSAQDMVSNHFNNKFKVVKNSIKSHGNSLVSMIVKANVKSIALDSIGENSNKKMVTAGVYTDTDDNSIWEVKEVNGQKRLFKKNEDDFESCFKYGNTITAGCMFTAVSPYAGDFVTFYNKNTGAVEAGFILVSNDHEMEVFTEDEELIPLDSEDEIVNALDLSECEMNPVEAAMSKQEQDKVLDYMRKIYKNSEMIAELKNIMDFKAAKEDKFETTASILDENFDDIKNDIQSFIINQAVTDLKAQLAPQPGEDVVEVEQANSQGDIDFADEKEIEEFFDEQDATDQVITEQAECCNEQPAFADVSFEDPEEHVSREEDFIDQEINSMLEADVDGDQNDFIEIETDDLDEDSLIAKLESMLGEDDQ